MRSPMTPQRGETGPCGQSTVSRYSRAALSSWKIGLRRSSLDLDMINFLDELAALGRNSVEFRALLGELLNGDSVIAGCEVDDVATIAAGNVVVDCEPSDAFRGALAAFLAEHPEFNQSR